MRVCAVCAWINACDTQNKNNTRMSARKFDSHLSQETLLLSPSSMLRFPMEESSTHGAPKKAMSALEMAQWQPCLMHTALSFKRHVFMNLATSSPDFKEFIVALSSRLRKSSWSPNMQDPEKSLSNTCWHAFCFSVKATLVAQGRGNYLV